MGQETASGFLIYHEDITLEVEYQGPVFEVEATMNGSQHLEVSTTLLFVYYVK